MRNFHTVMNGLLAAAIALCALPAAAQAVLYDKSRITCVSRQMNVQRDQVVVGQRF